MRNSDVGHRLTLARVNLGLFAGTAPCAAGWQPPEQIPPPPPPNLRLGVRRPCPGIAPAEITSCQQKNAEPSMLRYETQLLQADTWGGAGLGGGGGGGGQGCVCVLGGGGGSQGQKQATPAFAGQVAPLWNVHTRAGP